MFIIFIVLIVIIGLLMSAMILAQSPKGDGLAGALGAPGSVGTMFGARRTADFLVKGTIVLAGIFILFCIAINRLFLPTGTAIQSNPMREGPAPSAIPAAPSNVPVQQSAPPGQAPAQQAPAK